MKRKLSLLMVLMMVLTLIPAMPSFAGSGDISVQGRTDLVIGENTDFNNPPMVFLDNTPNIANDDSTRPIRTTGTAFTVVLDGNNADFRDVYPTGDQGGYTVSRISTKALEVIVTNVNTNAIKIPMHLRAIASGEVKIKFQRLSGFTGQSNSHLVATVQTQQSTIYVDRVGNIARNNNLVETRTSESRVRISENTAGAWIGADPIEIRLDDSKFSFRNNILFTMAGRTFNITQTTPGTTAQDLRPILDASGVPVVPAQWIDFGSITTPGTTNTFAELIDGGRTLRIFPDVLRQATVSGVNLYNQDTRNEISIDLELNVARNAEVGKDVVATLRGQISPTSIVLAKYTDYAVETKTEKVLEVIAGQDVPGRYKSVVTMEEMVPGSLLDGRVLEVSLVGVDKDGKEKEEVAAFQYGEVIRLNQLKGTGILNIVSGDLEVGAANKTTALVNMKSDGAQGDYVTHDLMEIEINKASNLDGMLGMNLPIADKWELHVPFVVSTDYTGDLFLKFHGAGIDNQKVKIADVKAPVTFEIGKANEKLADLNIGQQRQAAPDVTIKETVAGALLEVDVVRGLTNTYGIVAPSAKYNITNFGGTFTDGDTSIAEGNAKLKADDIVFSLERRTAKDPATILISGVKVTLDRTVPYGEFKIGIDAGNVKARHDLADRIDSPVYFNVVTPHPEDKNILTVFTIGEAAYKQTISGVEKNVDMDVAPQVVNNRTMMPIRYVADALGAKVNYDSATRTAIFSKDAIVVSMTLDSNIMYVNGSPVVMDVAPVVQNSRALVSLVNVAQAFGLNSVSAPAAGDIVYDASAKTVTLFPSAQ